MSVYNSSTSTVVYGMKKRINQFKNVRDKLTKLTGKNIEIPTDLLYLHHTFISESFMNLTLPKWAYDYFPDGPLLDGVVLVYKFMNLNPLMRRLFSGRMIHTILNNMIAIKNPNPPNTKIYLYSGHEINIVNLLQIFGLATFTHIFQRTCYRIA